MSYVAWRVYWVDLQPRIECPKCRGTGAFRDKGCLMCSGLKYFDKRGAYHWHSRHGQRPDSVIPQWQKDAVLKVIKLLEEAESMVRRNAAALRLVRCQSRNHKAHFKMRFPT